MVIIHSRQHELPYQSGIEERFLSLGGISFTIAETGWVGLGIILSWNMAVYIPAMSFFPFPASHIHYALPVVFMLAIAKVKHQTTALPYWRYIYLVILCRYRQRLFVYRRSNMPQDTPDTEIKRSKRK